MSTHPERSQPSMPPKASFAFVVGQVKIKINVNRLNGFPLGTMDVEVEDFLTPEEPTTEFLDLTCAVVEIDSFDTSRYVEYRDLSEKLKTVTAGTSK